MASLQISTPNSKQPRPRAATDTGLLRRTSALRSTCRGYPAGRSPSTTRTPSPTSSPPLAAVWQAAVALRWSRRRLGCLGARPAGRSGSLSITRRPWCSPLRATSSGSTSRSRAGMRLIPNLGLTCRPPARQVLSVAMLSGAQRASEPTQHPRTTALAGTMLAHARAAGRLSSTCSATRRL